VIAKRVDVAVGANAADDAEPVVLRYVPAPAGAHA